MRPYVVVSSIPHTLNEHNYWGSAIINACVAAIEHALNTETMNTPTDCVSHKTKWNYTLCVD